MAADVRIHRFYGPGPSTVDITNQSIRFAASESLDPPDSEGIEVPAPYNYNYSFTVPLRMYAESAPSGVISNLRVGSDGSNNLDGVYSTAKVVLYAYLSSAYVQAQGVVGVSGTQFSTSWYTGWRASIGDILLKNYGDPDGYLVYINGSSSGTHSGTGYFGEYMVFQARVGYNTSFGGVSSQDRIIITFDET